MKTLEQLLYEAKFTQEQIDKIMDVLIRHQLESLLTVNGLPVVNPGNLADNSVKNRPKYTPF